jgi:hypothetical protein
MVNIASGSTAGAVVKSVVIATKTKRKSGVSSTVIAGYEVTVYVLLMCC